MSRALLSFGFVAMLAAIASHPVSVSAEDFSGYWRLPSSDPNTSAGSSFTRAAWQNPDGSDTLEAVSPGRKYHVPAGVILRTPWNQNTQFAGDELAVAGTLYDGTGNAYLLTVPHLRLLPGGTYQFSNSSVLSADSSVSLEGTAESPATFQLFYFKDRWFKMRAPISGGTDSVVRMVHGTIAPRTRSEFLSTGLIMENERAGFSGKMVIGTNVHVRLDTKRYFPGEIEVLSNGYFNCGFWSGTTTLGGLTLNPGAQLLLQMTTASNYNIYTITNSFAASGAFGISPASKFHISDANTDGMVIMHLTGPAASTSADLSGADFSNLTLGRYGPLPRNPRLEYVQNGGGRDVRISWSQIVVMKQPNVASAGDSGTSQFAPANGSYWSTGEVPDVDFDGDVLVSVNNFSFEKGKGVDYPKMSVTKVDGGAIYHQANSATFSELNLVGKVNVYSYAGSSTKSLNGKVVLWPGDGPAMFRGWSNIRLDINAEVSGAGDMMIDNASRTTGYAVALNAANTGFSGNVTVASGDSAACTLYLNDGRNLGGQYSGTTAWKSFTVSNNAHVVVNGDVVLNEPTRGVFVTGGAQFTVPDGKIFEIDEPFTWGGVVAKLGAGTLVLGGEARFSDGASSPTATPVAGKNALTVSAGSLEAASTNALDGVAVTLAAGATLKVNMAAAGEGMRQYGFVSRKAGGSITSEAADGKIHIVFDKAAMPAPGDPVCEAAICTVPSVSAGTMSFALDDSYRSYSAEIVPRDNGDGTVTFSAKLTYRGFKVVFR